MVQKKQMNATCDLRYRIGGVSSGAISDQRSVNGAGRVLIKFQINLVIPEKHSYGYILTGAGIHIYMGIFIIIRGKV